MSLSAQKKSLLRALIDKVVLARVATDTVRVVATSAMRDARNSQAFLEWVRSTTGWNVEIISGLEEARLIHLGLVSSLRVTPQ